MTERLDAFMARANAAYLTGQQPQRGDDASPHLGKSADQAAAEIGEYIGAPDGCEQPNDRSCSIVRGTMQSSDGNEQQTRIDHPAKSPNPPPGACGQDEGQPATGEDGAGDAEPGLAGKIGAKHEPKANKEKPDTRMRRRDQLLPFAANRQGCA